MQGIKKKTKKLTREEAAELYKDLQKSMAQMKIKQSGAAPASKPAAIKEAERVETRDQEYRPGLMALFGGMRRSRASGASGHTLAIGLVITFAVAKVFLSALEYSGVASVTVAQASLMQNAPLGKTAGISGSNQAKSGYSKEELLILSSLDQRRADLEDRNRKLDEREGDLEKRDREYALRLTQLRELTEKLQVDFEKNEKKRSAQLEQLANVYGSMSPNEAAALMEQLDVTIALSLLERMPEKRIGQILALMTPERALTLTRMLSGKRD